MAWDLYKPKRIVRVLGTDVRSGASPRKGYEDPAGTPPGSLNTDTK